MCGRPLHSARIATDCARAVQDLPSRPRRNRRSETVRAAVSENSLSVDNFILPLFVHEGDKNEPIASMPGVDRLSFCNGLIDFVAEARSYGVNQVVIFPKARLLAAALRSAALHARCSNDTASVYAPGARYCMGIQPGRRVGESCQSPAVLRVQTPAELKTRTGEEAFNQNGLSQRSISALKDAFPDVEVYTDVALDPYNSDGHDGIVRDDGVIMNDETVEFLCRQAVSQVRPRAEYCCVPCLLSARTLLPERAGELAARRHEQCAAV
jgi:porphobilinogen synthase